MNTNSSDHSILNSDHNFWGLAESQQPSVYNQVPTTYTSDTKTVCTQDEKLKNLSKLTDEVGEISLADTCGIINGQDDILSKRSTSSKISSSVDSKVNHPKTKDDVTKPKLVSKRKDSSFFKSRSKDKNIICRFYSKNGFCGYGKNCKFTHCRQKSYINSEAEVVEEKSDLPESGANEFSKNSIDENIRYGYSTNNKSGYYRNQYKRNERSQRLPPRFSGKKDSSNKQADIKKEEAPKALQYEASVSLENAAIEEATSMKCQKDFMHNYNVSKNKTKNDNTQSAVCKYFRDGYCARGNRCWFRHSNNINKNETETILEINMNDEKDQMPSTEITDEHLTQIDNVKLKETEEKISRNNSFAREKFVNQNRRKINLKDATEEDMKKLREIEIVQLKKRFPHHEVLDGRNNGTLFSITFTPSDPDWPFEVRNIGMQVLFEEDYPRNICKIIMDEDERMPALLIKHLNKSIKHWLTEKHETNISLGHAELLFRSFLLWFDQNLENLFVAGLRMAKKEVEAKALGIEFVPFEDLQTNQSQDQSSDTENNHNQKELEEKFNDKRNKGEETTNADDNEKHIDVGTTGMQVTNTPPKRGTEVKLRGFRLGESAATLLCQKISLTFQCARCKTRHEMTTPPNRNNSISCTKCHRNILICFQPSLLHGYSATVGYLHLVDCLAVDIPLMECIFSVSCMNCSKQSRIDGIHYGQNHVTWCLYCNSKMSVFAESVKFHQLQPSEQLGGLFHQLKLEKKEKKIKDPRIQEGKPLPSNGTCKHYKKSFRWLRFPCCGKAYPCDYCHNEVELDHEMKYASRMICGFCAKEQPYTTTKPCIACSSDITKKAGSHWEGGRGCRDKIKMHRGDRQKYAGVNKTVPKKIQDTKD